MAKKFDLADEHLKESLKTWVLNKNAKKKSGVQLTGLLDIIIKIIKAVLGLTSGKLDDDDQQLQPAIDTWIDAKKAGTKKGNLPITTIIALILQILEAVFGDLQKSGQLPS